MQLCIRNNGCHASSNKQSSVDQLHFSNDAADDFSTCHRTFQRKTITDDTLRFLAKAAKLRMLRHMKECVKEMKRLCLLRSQILYRAAQGKSGSDYLCKKLGMMSCRHVLLVLLHVSPKLDALLGIQVSPDSCI